MSRLSQPPTIHDVARLANVSTSTASRAIGNYGRFSAATRDRVLAAANELGYRPNTLARSMITGRTHSIGVICADIGSPFFAGVVRGISDQARADGFSLLLTNTDEQVSSEAEAIDLLLDKKVDGIIVSPADVLDVEHLRRATTEGKPIVLIDRPSSQFVSDVVMVDDTAATEQATAHLLDLGHRRIGIVAELRIDREADWQRLLGPNLDTERGRLNASAARVLGYLRAHRAAGVPVDPSLVLRTGTYDTASATRATKELLGRPDRPTALVAIDNTTTVGAFQAIRELGIRVPAELSFVGFDNLDWTTLVNPALTLVEQPVHEIGVQATKRLIQRLAGDQSEPQLVRLPINFLIRESTARFSG